MSDQINNGGLVFPITDCASHQFHGMSLRDYFAAKSLSGLAAQPDALIGEPSSLAELAYQFADAMLAARGDA